MQVKDLLALFKNSADGWEYPADTVDTLKCGDPEMDVTGIAVAWMSTSRNLEAAVRLGCNTFVTHEPTFYDHFDRAPVDAGLIELERKRTYIRDQRLAIYRCHDLWDRIPQIGIPDSWGQSLGLEGAIFADEYARVYEVPLQRAEEFAGTVAARLLRYGQQAVQLIGLADIRVRTVAIGTGAITPFLRYVGSLGADLAICTDDGIDYWRDGAYAIDAGIPMVVVNHAVAEEAGVESLARWLAQSLPEVPVHFLPGRCLYSLVSAAAIHEEQEV